MRKLPYNKALKRIKRIKEFYNHLFIYIFFLIVWFLFADKFFDLIEAGIGKAYDGFSGWRFLNFWITPVIWGLVLIIQGICVFGFKNNPFKSWEEKKIQEYMNEGNGNTSKPKWE